MQPEIEPIIEKLRQAQGADEPAETLALLRSAQSLLSGAIGALSGEDPAAVPGLASTPEEAARYRGPGLGVDLQAEDRLLVERIQAMPGLSQSLREELAGYLRELETEALSSADRRYLVALRQRLARAAVREA